MDDALQVDFYVLEGERAKPDTLACRLARKAFERELTVFVRAADNAHAERLDEYLWTFEQLSFLPHKRAAEADADTPIQVGTDEAGACDVLINLAGTPPDDTARFRRIADIVGNDPASRNAGRARFKHYRDHGAEPTTHKLSNP